MSASSGSGQWHGELGGADPPSRQRAAVWVAVIVLAVLAVSAGLLWWLNAGGQTPPGTPEEQVSAAARNYVHTGAERGTEAAMGLMCREIRASWDASSAAQRANVDGVRSGTTVLAVNRVTVSGDQATARVVLRQPGIAGEQPRSMSFKKEEGKWKPCGAAP